MSRACLGALPKVRYLCQSGICLWILFDNNIWHLLCDILSWWSRSWGFAVALLRLWNLQGRRQKYMWQCLEEGRVNKGEDYLKVQRHKWLVPSVHHACTGYWGSPKPHLGRSKERGELKLPLLTPLRIEPSPVPRGRWNDGWEATTIPCLWTVARGLNPSALWCMEICLGDVGHMLLTGTRKDDRWAFV